MPRLMQMAELYIRGAMATQTMKNLTDEQRAEVERIVAQVAADQALAPDRSEFIKQLGNTIKGDYKSDKKAAEHEFHIAIWRATVYLLYDRTYSYYCTLCGQSEYTTTKNNQKAFDRQYKICPYCKRTILGDKTVKLQHKSRGYCLMSVGETAEAVSELFPLRAQIEKLVTSPIKTVAGDRRVDDPHKVLGDAEQRSKWYSVWVWNYFRQILNENTIHTHNKRQVMISGPATAMAVHEILNEFQAIGRKYHFDETTIYDNEVEILASTIAQDEKWVAFFIALVRKYANYNVAITPTFYSIKVVGVGLVPTIDTSITTSEQVMTLSLSAPDNTNTEAGNWSDILESNASKKYEIADGNLDDEDLTSTIRAHMPTALARGVFDIYTQKGPIWATFSDQYGQRIAAKSHLSRFFDIPIKQIDECRQQIEDAYLAHEDNVYGERRKKLISLSVEPGEFLLALTINGETLAHTGMDCPHIEKHTEACDPPRKYVAEVLHTRHKFIRLKGLDRMIMACPHCVEHAAADSI